MLRLKNVVIFIETILSFVLSRKIVKILFTIEYSLPANVFGQECWIDWNKIDLSVENKVELNSNRTNKILITNTTTVKTEDLEVEKINQTKSFTSSDSFWRM